jgi:hypothetical protein
MPEKDRFSTLKKAIINEHNSWKGWVSVRSPVDGNEVCRRSAAHEKPLRGFRFRHSTFCLLPSAFPPWAARRCSMDGHAPALLVKLSTKPPSQNCEPLSSFDAASSEKIGATVGTDAPPEPRSQRRGRDIFVEPRSIKSPSTVGAAYSGINRVQKVPGLAHCLWHALVKGTKGSRQMAAPGFSFSKSPATIFSGQSDFPAEYCS